MESCFLSNPLTRTLPPTTAELLEKLAFLHCHYCLMHISKLSYPLAVIIDQSTPTQSDIELVSVALCIMSMFLTLL